MYNSYIVRYKYDPEKKKMIEVNVNQDSQVMGDKYVGNDNKKEKEEQQTEVENITKYYSEQQTENESAEEYYREWENDSI